MDYPSNVWRQLKNITVKRLIKALKDDEWEKCKVKGARYPFKKEGNKGKADRVVIHYHPKKTFSKHRLNGMLDDIGWSTADLKRLNLIDHDPKKYHSTAHQPRQRRRFGYVHSTTDH